MSNSKFHHEEFYRGKEAIAKLSEVAITVL